MPCFPLNFLCKSVEEFKLCSQNYEILISYLKDINIILLKIFESWNKNYLIEWLMSKIKFFLDVLLCHDDELEGRRIAYILYLVDENWEKSDGGCLDLFKVNSDNQPTSIVSSVVPQWNSFAFFAVSPVSFHQVSEVVTQNKCRLSVSGWFHGEPILRPPPFLEPVKNLTKPVDMDVILTRNL